MIVGTNCYLCRDPVPGFDRRKVKGMVAKLFQVREEMFCSGLKATGGGKLYNAVVATAAVGKQLLDGRCLQRRVTMIPMDNIKVSCASTPYRQSTNAITSNTVCTVDLVLCFCFSFRLITAALGSSTGQARGGGGEAGGRPG